MPGDLVHDGDEVDGVDGDVARVWKSGGKPPEFLSLFNERVSSGGKVDEGGNVDNDGEPGAGGGAGIGGKDDGGCDTGGKAENGWEAGNAGGKVKAEAGKGCLTVGTAGWEDSQGFFSMTEVCGFTSK